MSAKYGFVYIWRDRKHKRYYIGAHWGTEDDGYICSSTWMRNSYRRRPQDFKRRILFNSESREDVFDKEYQWLKLIPKHKLGKTYYNLAIFQIKIGSYHQISEKTKEKMSISKLGNKHCLGIKQSNESKEKKRLANLGKTRSEETKEKLRLLGLGNKNTLGKNLSKEHKDKISKNHASKQEGYVPPMLGKKYSKESKEKMRQSALNAWKKRKEFLR